MDSIIKMKIKKDIGGKQKNVKIIKFFPELCVYTLAKLYKIVGCFIVGFDVLDGLNSRLIFVIKSLNQSPDHHIEENLKAAIINGKGLDLDLDLDSDGNHNDESSTYFSKFVGFPLEGDVKLEAFLSVIELYRKDIAYNDGKIEGILCSAFINPVHKEIKLLELEFLLYLYVGYIEEASKILTKIEEQCKQSSWISYGKANNLNLEQWHSKLKYYLSNREEYISNFEKLLKGNRRLRKLKRSEIMI